MATINSWGSQFPAGAASGGTGLATITSHGIMVGAGTGNVVPLAEASDGQLPIGSTGNAPVLAALTAGTGISITNAAGSITVTNSSTGDLSINAQTGTTYTTVLSDAGKLVTCDNAAAITLTIPPNSSVAYSTGTQILIEQKGAGTVTITPGSGVTIRSRGSLLALNGQYAVAALIKTATDEWIASGDLA